MNFLFWWASDGHEMWRAGEALPSQVAQAAWQEAARLEREACARLVETAGAYTDWNEDAVDLAARIRAGEG